MSLLTIRVYAVIGKRLCKLNCQGNCVIVSRSACVNKEYQVSQVSTEITMDIIWTIKQVKNFNYQLYAHSR